jgi:hypothetical protein
MTMTVADTRPANYGASRAANHCADRASNNCTGCAADCGAGHSTFRVARGVRHSGQGSERRETRDDKKFAHRILQGST